MEIGPTFFRRLEKQCPGALEIGMASSASNEGKFYSLVSQEVK